MSASSSSSSSAKVAPMLKVHPGGSVAIDKAFSSVSRDGFEEPDQKIGYTISPREWIDAIDLSKVGKDRKSFVKLLDDEGLLEADDFSGIKFLKREDLRALGLLYSEIKKFEDAVDDLVKYQQGNQSMMMNWQKHEPKPSVATSHKCNYIKGLDLNDHPGLEFPTNNPYGLKLTGSRVGGRDWATIELGGERGGKQTVSGMIVMIRFNVRSIHNVDTEGQKFDAHFIMEAFIDMSVHPGLTNADGSQLNPSTWEPRLHFANIVETKRWDCRPTILLNTQDDTIASIRFKYTIQATFSEPMELGNFPFDVQALHLTLYSKRANKSKKVAAGDDGRGDKSASHPNDVTDGERRLGELTLVPLPPERHTFQIYNMPEVNTFDPLSLHGSAAYPGGGEYLSCQSNTSLMSQSSRGKMYPVLHVYCAMQRKSGYYIANIVVPLFLITCIAFAGVEYGIDDEYDSLSPRMDVSLGLLLTAVAFKYSIAEDLPSISYLTSLDKYIVFTYGILTVTCFQAVSMHAAYRMTVVEPLSILTDDANATLEEFAALNDQEALLETIDVWFNIGLLGVFVLFSVIWVLVGCMCKGKKVLDEVREQIESAHGFEFPPRRLTTI